MTTQQTNRAAVDLTPYTVNNWDMCPDDVPVVTVNPDASLHHRLALAWGMASELHDIAEAGVLLKDEHAMCMLFAIMGHRLRDLERLLDGIGHETSRPLAPAVQQGGAA